ncbi:MAG: S41 family peptidase [Phaeodactylibacter xiamenensis]|uniref:Tail specific protease domain-containing protein n=1 Tax=Phaeodactylibacter xiamenensis TaxID=1524460 RepID=A0A098SBC2_9BACT|nr:S41 family peptidase [Phaeodactylibacter xiamenensis]KGE88327.1 hypothetical protein IX84_08975 [Phaeodactylibacter xiamenensis]MCR9054443.1 S41 family peptidase [bacterium]
MTKQSFCRNLVFLLTIALSACASYSTIGIPAGEEFVLGEQENSSFRAELKNLSSATLNVRTIDKITGEQTQGFTLPGRGQTQLRAGRRETVLLSNPTTRAVKVKARLSKSVEGMRYQQMPETNPSNDNQIKAELVSGRLLQKDSLLADIDLLERALTEIHPGIYRYNSPESINREFDRLRAQVYAGMTEAAFMKILAQSIKKIRCGHTYLNPWNMNAALRERMFGGRIYFPLGFSILNEQFIVTHNASEASGIRPGAAITSINGISAKTILDSLSTIAKVDGNNNSPVPHYLSVSNVNASHWNAFDLYFPLFFPMEDAAFTIDYQNYGAEPMQTVTLKALKKEEREAVMKQRFSNSVSDNNRWSLDLSNPDLAVMRLNTFAIWKWKDFDQAKWFKQSFRTIRQLGISNLAIDIRGNGGGLSEPRNELISYLIQKELGCSDGGKVLIRTTKVNPVFRPYSRTWNEIIFEGLPPQFYTRYDDTFFELKEEAGCRNISPKKNRFKGQAFILGGPGNVSATFTLLQKARHYGFATFVGQESGGNQQGINGGEYLFFYLPHSQMEVDIPLKYLAPPGERPDEGVAPEVEVTLTQEDIAQGQDPCIDYILEVIK